MEIKPISRVLQQQLADITPSKDSVLKYYPCQVELKDGTVLDNVYIADYDSYISSYSVLPGDDQLILIEDVIVIHDSPNRLPAKLANKLYNAGESGMGYCVFRLLYDTGDTFDVLTGNAVDFVPSPEDLSVNHIVDVLPHEGSRQDYTEGLSYSWCLYKGVEK